MSEETVKKKKKNVKVNKVTAKLQLKIEELERALTESEDKTLRLHAEYDNYRKRSFRELADTRKAVKADTIESVLNVFDHFKMAVQATETSDNMEMIKQGMTMIATEFEKAMDDMGVIEINAIGKDFDPLIHEAIAKESSEEEEDKIIKQWSCGYKLGDRLLRPAKVVVSSGPEEEIKEESNEGGE